MPKEFTQEMIDQYLSKQLKGEALVAFESKMNTDPVFKKEMETQAFIHRGVNKFGEDEMRSKLKKIRAEVLGKEGGKEDGGQKTEDGGKGKVVPLGQKKRTKLILRWSMAATIALAIGASVYLIATRQNVSSLDLYASYYEPFNEEINVRNAAATSIANQASQLYKAKKYEAAIPLFLQILESEPNNAEVQLATGVSQLELGRFEKATQTFSAVSNPLFKDQAQWYLSMTFLKQSDMTNAKTILEAVKKGDFNYTKAQEILQAL